MSGTGTCRVGRRLPVPRIVFVDVDAPQSIGLDHVDEVAQIGADVAADLEHACRGKSRGMPRPEWSASTAGGGVAGHVLIAELAVPQLLEPRRLIDVAHGLTCLESTVRLFVGTEYLRLKLIPQRVDSHPGRGCRR